MPITNHSTAAYSIYQMVLNRLMFMADTPANEQLISSFTYEVMTQLNICFKLDEADIGDETKYTVLQKSIIADIVCLYILFMQAAGVAGGIGGNAPTGATFISKAKAGSVEVEYSQFNIKTGSSLAMDGTALISFYKKQAINKAAALGCTIDICDDCSMSASLIYQNNVNPFIVYPASGCEGCGS